MDITNLKGCLVENIKIDGASVMSIKYLITEHRHTKSENPVHFVELFAIEKCPDDPHFERKYMISLPNKSYNQLLENKLIGFHLLYNPKKVGKNGL